MVFLSACRSPSLFQHPTTSSTLWMQNAAEYEALSTSIYQAAAAKLGTALEDTQWSAYPPQADKNLRGLPPAIIVDVDETVLDNTAFQVRLINRAENFNIADWNRWVMEAESEAVPGALSFLTFAKKEGVAIYYLTNREAKVEKGTRKNLLKLGFPLSGKGDYILSKGEHSEWTASKENRRSHVASRHRILMIFGDDLNDFLPAGNISQRSRSALVKTHKSKWGERWFILPNPAYGSWESALDD